MPLNNLHSSSFSAWIAFGLCTKTCSVAASPAGLQVALMESESGAAGPRRCLIAVQGCLIGSAEDRHTPNA